MAAIKNECDPLSVTNIQIKSESHMQKNSEGKSDCNQCERKFSSKSNLNSHIKSKHEGIKYTCDQCEFKATKSYYIKSHIQQIHETVKNAPFENLDLIKSEQKFKSKVILEEDFQTLYSYACSFCDKKFGNKNEWRKHVSDHRKEQIVRNKEVNQEFCTDPIKSEKEDNIESVKIDYHHCQFCDFFTSSKLLLDNHMISHGLLCNYNKCGAIFKTKEEKRSHMLQIHNFSYKKCNVCKKEFESLRKAKEHRKNAHDSYRVCNFCKIEFESLRKAKEHRRNAHNSYRKCNVCKIELESYKKFKEHRRNAHPFICTSKFLKHRNGCSLHFDNAEQLQQHLIEEKQKRQEEIKNRRALIKCRYCDRCFYSNRNLKRHELTCKHNPDPDPLHQSRKIERKLARQQKCEKCEEFFPNNWKLGRHYRKTGHNTELICACGYRPPGDKFAVKKKYFRVHTRACSAAAKENTAESENVNKNDNIECSNIFVVF